MKKKQFKSYKTQEKVKALERNYFCSLKPKERSHKEPNNNE